MAKVFQTDLKTQKDIIKVLVEAINHPEVGLRIGRGSIEDDEGVELNSSKSLALVYIRAPFCTKSSGEEYMLNVTGVIQNIDGLAVFLNLDSVTISIEDEIRKFTGHTDEVEHFLRFLATKGVFNPVFA